MKLKNHVLQRLTWRMRATRTAVVTEAATHLGSEWVARLILTALDVISIRSWNSGMPKHKIKNGESLKMSRKLFHDKMRIIHWVKQYLVLRWSCWWHYTIYNTEGNNLVRIFLEQNISITWYSFTEIMLHNLLVSWQGCFYDCKLYKTMTNDLFQ